MAENNLLYEFNKLWETGIYVETGGGSISRKGISLCSGTFSQCTGLILMNRANLESALFHINDLDINEDQGEIVNEFITDYINGLDLKTHEKKIICSAVNYVTKFDNSGQYGFIGERELKDKMQKLNQDGIIQAKFIYGDASSSRTRDRTVKFLLDSLGVKIDKDIPVRARWWEMIYHPNDSKIYVRQTHSDKILESIF
jgi:hypothetical protein